MKFDTRSISTTRNVARRTHRGRKAHVTKSLHDGMEIRVESRGEMLVAKLLGLDPRVASVKAQYQTFDLNNGTVLTALPIKKPLNARYYTPDFLALIDGIQTAIEVKPERFCAENEEFFDEIRGFCLARGMKFIVVSQESFSPVLIQNLNLLHQYKRQCELEIHDWASAVARLGTLDGHVKTVLQTLTPMSHYLIAAILTGVLSVDLEKIPLQKLDFQVTAGHGDLSWLEFIRHA